MSEIMFKRTNGGCVKINANVLSNLFSFSQIDEDSCEAGGILLGRFILDSKNIVIDDISTPGNDDIGRRCYYFRTRKFHQDVVLNAWKSSNGTSNYLGEWHSHPEDYPNPSQFDLLQWKKVLESFEFDSDSLFFIIVGKKSVEVWEGIASNKRIYKLNVIE